jgi:hypothetical protein
MKNLNDNVEKILLALIEVPEFHHLIMATKDADAYEGSLFIDDVLAAQMIRQYAVEQCYSPTVAGARLDKVVRSLRVVLRRFNMSRAQRRGKVGEPT